MYPLNKAAFTRAQASRRKLINEYRHAFILDADGSLRQFEHIEVIGPWGESIGRKLLSRLTNAWRIDIRLTQPLDYSLERIKQLLINCSASTQSADSLQLDDIEMQKFVASVSAATSIGQLLELLRLPAPEDALDVL